MSDLIESLHAGRMPIEIKSLGTPYWYYTEECGFLTALLAKNNHTKEMTRTL